MAETTALRRSERRYLPAAERKSDLLDHGVCLIREKGWENLTMVDLARRAGVSRQLVYQYFGNLEQLALELANRFQDEVYAAAVEAIERHPKDFEKAMRETLQTFFVGLREERLTYVELLTGHWPNPRLPSSLKEVRDRKRRLMIEIWSEYYQKVMGLAPLDATALSSFQYEGLRGLATLVDSGQLSTEDAIDMFLDVLRGAIERFSRKGKSQK